MVTYNMTEAETLLAELIWEQEPIGSGNLVKLAAQRLGWKKSTTYTVIKKLEKRGFLRNDTALVTALVLKEECQAAETDYFMNRTFEGSLPKFVAAFLGNRKISEREAKEIKAMIDSHREHS